MSEVVSAKTSSASQLSESSKPIDWLDILLKTELRALAAVSSEITHLISDTSTSASGLAAMILKDAALTSQVLKIAGSVSYKNDMSHNGGEPRSQDSALRQAIVRIGFNGIRCICISIALIENISKKTDKKRRLLESLVRAFHTAIHARNVAEKIGKCRAEDVFIAGLLQNIGELVFWNSPIPETKAFKEALPKVGGIDSDAAKLVTGMSFEDMSKCLAEVWSLSNTLTDSFNPSVINSEVKAITLGLMMSQGIEAGWSSERLKMALGKISSDLSMDLNSAMLMLQAGAEETTAMASEYGADSSRQLSQPTGKELTCVDSIELVDDIVSDHEAVDTKATAEINEKAIRVAKNKLDQAANECAEAVEHQVRQPDAARQVELFDQLWEFSESDTSQDDIFNLLVDGVFSAVGLERVALLTHDGKREELRLACWAGTVPTEWSTDLVVSVSQAKDSLFRYAIRSRSAELLSAATLSGFDDLITSELKAVIGEREAVLLVPIRNGLRVVAVLYADMGDENFEISDAHVAGFSRLAKQVCGVITMSN